MPFVPVAVGDYLKKFSDVLNKKYKKLKTNNLVVKAADGEGMTIESTIMNKYPDKIAGATGTSPEGSVKVTYDMSSYKTSGEIYTDTQSKSTFKLENTGIKGLTVTASGSGIPAKLAGKNKSNLALEAVYKRDMFNGSCKATYYNQNANVSPKVDAYEAYEVAAAASVGKDGVSMGGNVTAVNEKAFAVTKWGVGANLSKGPLIFGLFSTKLEDVETGVFYKANSKTNLGLMGKIYKGKDSKKNETSNLDLGLGMSHKFNPLTVVEAKAQVNLVKAGDATSQAVSYGAVIEKSIPDLSSKLQLTTTLSEAKGSVFGICCTYGDK